MQVTDVRAVIAIGLSGQFGLRGRLPWEGNRGREYIADVERFFELTRGHVLIMGHRTFTLAPDFAFKDRGIIEIHASDRPADALARFPSRVLFIAGGPPVYATCGPFIRHWDINRLPYDGDANVTILLGCSRAAIGFSAALCCSPAERIGMVKLGLRTHFPRSGSRKLLLCK
jgi:dihydromethanopterin reductase